MLGKEWLTRSVELAEYTAMSAKRRAEAAGTKDVYVSPSAASARRHSGSESLRTGSAASDEETLDAHSTCRMGWSACREALDEQLRHSAWRQPVPEHHVGGSDGESVRSVMVDAENPAQPRKQLRKPCKRLLRQ